MPAGFREFLSHLIRLDKALNLFYFLIPLLNVFPAFVPEIIILSVLF